MAEKTVAVRKQEAASVPSTREEERYLIPPVDIYETEDGLGGVVDLPGVEKSDLEVSVRTTSSRSVAVPSITCPGEPSVRSSRY